VRVVGGFDSRVEGLGDRSLDNRDHEVGFIDDPVLGFDPGKVDLEVGEV